MKHIVLTFAAALTLLLGGCAATIRSDVTTFHQWPAAPQDKSYVFVAPPAQDDTLELHSYENLVRAELTRLGFHEAAPGGAANLKVAMHFSTTDIPVRVVYPAYPYTYYPSRFDYGWPYRHRYWGGFYGPFYDPFWFNGPVMEEHVQHQYRRELKVAILTAADGKHLFDVTVHNTSRQLSTPAVMPALVQSAFEGFPGPNGVARRIELKQNG
ncbi:MAG: DUF4136 domain-containing protein [Pseudomonadota bacterium]